MMPATRPFTGRNMALIMVAFFGVIIIVNVTMAVLAAQTFGGKVVDNSYVATQRFNGWLAQARRQERLGWDESVQLTPDRYVELDLKRAGEALRGARIDAEASHPLGGEDDIHLVLVEIVPGRYRSDRPLPLGRWHVQIIIAADDATKRLIETLQ